MGEIIYQPTVQGDNFNMFRAKAYMYEDSLKVPTALEIDKEVYSDVKSAVAAAKSLAHAQANTHNTTCNCGKTAKVSRIRVYQ